MRIHHDITIERAHHHQRGYPRRQRRGLADPGDWGGILMQDHYLIEKKMAAVQPGKGSRADRAPQGFWRLR